MKTSKYSDCSKCPLVEQGRCLGETNCKDDLSKVDVLILAEAPAQEEIKQNRPLVGRSGQVFRKAFLESGLEKTNHMITNVVLCSNITDGKTTNPPKEAIECCKPNWKALINIIKPKVILLMGSIPMQSFGLSDNNITKKRGIFYKYETDTFSCPIMLTLHPSYIMRQSVDGSYMNSNEWKMYIEDMKSVVSFLSEETSCTDIENLIEEEIADVAIDCLKKETENVETKKEEENQTYSGFSNASNKNDIKILGAQEVPYAINLPSWCYEQNVSLFDVQNIQTENMILYTFKTENGKKYHKTSSDENYYYIGDEMDISDSPMLVPVNSVNLVLGRSPRDPESATYESDVRSELKRSIDYRFFRKEEEPNYPLKKMFFDIEVYNKRNRRFPDPKKAESPINAISFKIGDDPVNVWICRLPQMDKNELHVPDGVLYKSYASEYNLLQAFAKLVRDTNPDILTGWNSLGFDMMTIYGRMLKLGVDPNLMSPINTTYVDSKRYGKIFIYGMHVMDMLDLYKELTYSVEESYKLDYIAQKHLNTGKVSYSGTLDELYEENLSEFIRYSAVDTDILYKLDMKLKHIDLKRELIRICCSTWKASETTMGLVDSLCISYAKKENLVCRNAVIKSNEINLPGAYVRRPIKGRHNYVIDLDFTSLYPSIICSCNIGPNTYVAKIDPSLAYNIIYKRETLNPEEDIDIILNPIKKNCKKQTIKLKQLLKTLDTKKSIITVAGTIYKNHDEELSFLNKILTHLLNSRKQYKNMMKDALKGNDNIVFQRYDNMQLSYKILANSIYGVLANPAFRFFNIDLATSITLTGQEIIKFSGYHLGYYMKDGKMEINSDFIDNYDDADIPYLIYTDTDSIFIGMGDYLIENKKI